MVRAFTLLCKLISYKLSDKVLFDTFFAKADLLHLPCPHCGSTSNHSLHSSYHRYMITMTNGKRRDYSVTIPRIKCHCGRTHAVLPDLLIPYGSYSLRFILSVLSAYLTRSISVQKLCLHYQLAWSTLYQWIHLFLNHHNLLSGIISSLDRLDISAIIWAFSYEALPKDFYRRFRFSFLQPHRTTATNSDTS